MSILSKSVAVLALACSSTLAIAATPLKCDGGDEGFTFGGAVPRAGLETQGTLTLDDEAGHQEFVLTCIAPAIDPTPGGFDMANPVMDCSDRNDINTGYLLEVKSGGIAGIKTATVKKANFRALPLPVSQLTCHF